MITVSPHASPQASVRTARRRPHAPALAIILLLLAWMLPVTPSMAGINACPDGNGGTVFQDRPCDREPARATAERSSVYVEPPGGLHASWFERPEFAEGNAWCDRRGCECGVSQRRFDSGLTLAVADALYIDGNWHRYRAEVSEWESGDKNSAEKLQFHRNVIIAACEVMMSQRTLRLYLLSTIKSLRNLALEAEDRGANDPASCDGTRPGLCPWYEKFELYERMKLDANALHMPYLESPTAFD